MSSSAPIMLKINLTNSSTGRASHEVLKRTNNLITARIKKKVRLGLIASIELEKNEEDLYCNVEKGLRVYKFSKYLI